MLIEIKKIVLTAIFATTVACGNQESDLFEDSTAESSDIKVYFVQDELTGKHMFIASTPESVDTLQYCKTAKANETCDPTVTVTMRHSPELKTNRNIYVTDLVDFKSGYLLINSPRDPNFARRLSSADAREKAGVVDSDSTSNSNSTNTASGNGWKSLYMAADYRDFDEKNNVLKIVAWDNGRRDIAKLMKEKGYLEKNMVHLASDPEVIKNEPGVIKATYNNFDKALTDLKVTKGEGCFVFMTSHGNDQGFHMELEQGNQLTPSDFKESLDGACGDRPTIAMVSACYAGIMVNQDTKKDNRIIFTAASAYKPSMGCAPGIEYNLFEECMVAGLKDAAIKTYEDLGASMKTCINKKDRSDPNPYFFIGDKMKNLPISANVPF